MKRSLFALAVLCALPSNAVSVEPVSPVLPSENRVTLGSSAELRDDIYSLDADLSGEIVLFRIFALSGRISYRTISYEDQMDGLRQQHAGVNLDVSGWNSPWLGASFSPFDFLKFSASFRFPPGDGDRTDRFPRYGGEGAYLFCFSDRLLLSFAVEGFGYLERDGFLTGPEAGAKYSLSFLPGRWNAIYVCSYRRRVIESENRNLDPAYRKMSDLYGALRMRAAVSRSFSLFNFPFSAGIAYEISRGNLYGMETGHRVEIYLEKEFP